MRKEIKNRFYKIARKQDCIKCIVGWDRFSVDVMNPLNQKLVVFSLECTGRRERCASTDFGNGACCCCCC